MSEKAVQEVEGKLAELPMILDRVTVRDSAGYEQAAEFLVWVKQRRREVDEAFDPSVRAAYEAHRKMVALKRKFTDKMDAAEAEVKGRMNSYRAEQERICKEREAELVAQLEKEGIENAVVAVQPTVPKIEGISTRKVWKFKIEDASKLPPEFLIPDEAKLGAYARAMREMAKVPGVRFFAEDSMSVRS